MIRQGQLLGHQDGSGMLIKQVYQENEKSNMDAENNNVSQQSGNIVVKMDSQPPQLHLQVATTSIMTSSCRNQDETSVSSSQTGFDVHSRGVVADDMDENKHDELDEHDFNMFIADGEGMSDTLEFDDVNNVKGGMKTRGNRRPTLLTERMRQKRQTLQDMAKPLKTWLYEHRDNPYPTKTEKMVLAVGSQMTLVQVSNWFANARRRLKNTVRKPGLTWSKRIKMYNSHVTGNAERLSISSRASSISDGDYQEEQSFDDKPPQLNCYETTSNISSVAPSTMSQDNLHTDYNFQPTHDEGAQHRYKHSQGHSILNRYLNDSFEHAQRYHQHQNAESSRRRNGSGTGSVSSHDYEDVSLSRLSPHSEQSNDISGQQGSAFFDDLPNGDFRNRLQTSPSNKEEEDTYWKEINAALALTNMARACRKQQPIITM